MSNTNEQSAWDAVRGSEPAYADLDGTSRDLLCERASRVTQDHTVTDSDTVQGRFECEVLRQLGIEPVKSIPAPKAKAAPKQAVKKAVKKPAPKKIAAKPVKKPAKKPIKKGAKKR